MLELMNFHRVRGSLRVLSAVVGASVVVTMGAVTVAYSGNEGDPSTASTNGWAVATLTVTTAPSALETPVAARQSHPMPEKGDYAMHRLIAAGTLTIDRGSRNASPYPLRLGLRESSSEAPPRQPSR